MKYCATLKMIGSVLILHTVTSCSEKILETPGINYAKSSPLKLNVQDIQVVSIPEVHPSKNKHAQEEAVLLRSEIEKWARTRLVSEGGADRAVMTINKVNIKVLKDPKAEVERVKRDFYVGKVDVKLDILDDRGFVKGSVSSSVEQTVGIPETYTYYEREAQIKRLREELMNSLDARMVKEISQNLSLYMMQ